MKTKQPFRVKIAAWILFSVFAVSVLSFWNVQYHCRRLRAKTDRVTALIEADAPVTDIEAAIRILQSQWEEDADMLGLVLPGQMLSDLNEAICRLPALSTDRDDLAAELLSVSADLRRICAQEMTVL